LSSQSQEDLTEDRKSLSGFRPMQPSYDHFTEFSTRF